MEPYKHIVQYYETDKMGITHHSNYVRWMEEARIDFLRQIGWDYAKLEECGIVSPVVGIDCKYQHPTTFSDEVYIEVKVKEFNGALLKLEYLMTNADGQKVLESHSQHCFLGSDGKFLRLNKKFPEFNEVLCQLASEAVD